MALGQLYLIGGRDKPAEAIHRIQEYDPMPVFGVDYALAFSGGKDSTVTYDLAVLSGRPFTAHYCRTGIDPPEQVRFIRQNYPEVVEIPPTMSMWAGIQIHGLPLRQRRWCCQVLKEHAGDGHRLMQGVRWAESAKRRKRWDVYTEHDSRKGSKVKRNLLGIVSPIVDWTDDDIWEYIKTRNLKYCQLYDEGFKRLGCILCPFVSGEGLRREMQRWPKIVEAFKRAAIRYYDRRKQEESFNAFFQSGEAYFDWWIEERLDNNMAKLDDPDVLKLFD